MGQGLILYSFIILCIEPVYSYHLPDLIDQRQGKPLPATGLTMKIHFFCFSTASLFVSYKPN